MGKIIQLISHQGNLYALDDDGRIWARGIDGNYADWHIVVGPSL